MISRSALVTVVWSRLLLDLAPNLMTRPAAGSLLLSLNDNHLVAEAVPLHLKVASHRALAEYFASQPTWFQPAERARPNARRASELVYQQTAAGLLNEAEQALSDYDNLEAKCAGGGVFDLAEDYDLLLRALPDSETSRKSGLEALQGVIRLSAHVVSSDHRELAGQLWGRLHDSETPIVLSCLASAEAHRRRWLQPITQSLTAPKGALIREYHGMSAGIPPGVESATFYKIGQEGPYGVRVTPDGERIVAGVWRTSPPAWQLKTWDRKSAREVLTLAGETPGVVCFALAPDGRRAVVGSEGNLLTVWNLEERRVARRIDALTYPFGELAVSAADRCFLYAWSDKTLRSWDLNSGELSEATPPFLESGFHHMFLAGCRPGALHFPRRLGRSVRYVYWSAGTLQASFGEGRYADGRLPRLPAPRNRVAVRARARELGLGRRLLPRCGRRIRQRCSLHARQARAGHHLR